MAARATTTSGRYYVVTAATQCIRHERAQISSSLDMERHPSGVGRRRVPWRPGAARRALVNAVDCKQDQEIRAEWNGAALAAAAAAPFSGVLAAASATYGAAAAAAGGRADGARALAITISC